ncbi:MAG: tetratricopeptide repeat protein [Candidatus Obscuribacterales bacterium]
MKNRTRVLLLACVSATVYGCARAERADEKTWKESFDSGFSAVQSKNYAGAESNFRNAVESAKAFPKNDVRLAQTYDALGDVYIAENNIEDAKRAYGNSYNIYKQLWNWRNNSVNNRDFAIGLSRSALHLANIACDALRLDEAERLYDEALSVEESVLGPDVLKEQILAGKEKLYRLTGRTSDAEKIKEQIAELKALPSVDDTQSMSWKQLNEAGNEAFQSGNLAKAEKIYSSGVERARKPLQQAESMRGLARIFEQQKEFGKAIGKLEQARTLLRGDDHRLELADNLNLSGFCYLRLKQYASAEKMFGDAINVLQLKNRGDADRGKISYEGLTRAYTDEGNYAEAEKSARSKMALTLELNGKKDARYAEDLLAVTVLQAKEGKNDEAQKGFETVIELEEGNPSPRYMLAALDSFGKFLRDTRQDARADAIELRAKTLRAEFE